MGQSEDARVRANIISLGRDRRGTSAVEFAIVAPVFIMVLFLMIGFGVYLGAAHSVQQLAADTARASIAGLDESERVSLANAFIKNNGDTYMLIDSDDLSVAVKDNSDEPNQFRVDLTYDASKLPIWGIYGAHLLPQKTIVRRSTIRIGGL